MNETNFLNREDWRIFTDEEVDRIWEEFFGSRFSINHIARNFDVSSTKIIRVLETEQKAVETRKKARSSRKTNVGSINTRSTKIYENYSPRKEA